jgi:hypothetical protein
MAGWAPRDDVFRGGVPVACTHLQLGNTPHDTLNQYCYVLVYMLHPVPWTLPSVRWNRLLAGVQPEGERGEGGV